jgi:hypothetical protein
LLVVLEEAWGGIRPSICDEEGEAWWWEYYDMGVYDVIRAWKACMH